MKREINFRGTGQVFGSGFILDEKGHVAKRENVTPKNIALVAQDIAAERGAMVATTLLFCGVIRLLPGGRAQASDRIRCGAAQVQKVKATRGNQAAHLLPGQIFVNNHCIWTLANVSDSPKPRGTNDRAFEVKVQKLHFAIKQCFGETRTLPACFNRADSAAEGTGVGNASGLKTLFGECVEKLWETSRSNDSCELAVDRVALKKALEHWFRNANQIYQSASARKLDKAIDTDGGEKEEDRINEGLILETYASSYQIVHVDRLLNSSLLQQFRSIY